MAKEFIEINVKSKGNERIPYEEKKIMNFDD